MLAATLLAGCHQPDLSSDGRAAEVAPFAPVSMRVHPIFTQIKDWTGDGRPDGIEALVEFQDAFTDPTKAAGKLVFELFEYRAGPDPRGDRVVNPWIGSLADAADQRRHWDHTSRAYSFLLAYPGIDRGRPYVLTAGFEPPSGGRLFDRVILQPPAVEPRREPTPPPATQPGRRTPEP